jgi:hypothetical protein
MGHHGQHQPTATQNVAKRRHFYQAMVSDWRFSGDALPCQRPVPAQGYEDQEIAPPQL